MIDGKLSYVSPVNGWRDLSGHVIQNLGRGAFLVNATFYNETGIEGKSIVLVKDIPAVLVDDYYIAGWWVKRCGEHQYTSVLGGTKTVAAYTVGKITLPPQPKPMSLEEAARLKSNSMVMAKADASRVLTWQMEKASNGYASAQCSLGKRYLTGDGVVSNLDLAKFWLNKSAAQDDVEAKQVLKRIP